jgi:hypothetical protein
VKTAKWRYERRQQRYEEFLQAQKKTDRKISNLRLIVFAVGAFTAVLTYIYRSYALLAAAAILFSGVFIYLVVYQDKLINRIRFTTLLLDINKTSLKRVNGEWNSFIDAGEDFLDDSHNYTSDLDVFGKGSLFQWISAANIFTGREKLRDLLTDVKESRTDICERQEAVDELAMILNWRQRFSAGDAGKGFAVVANEIRNLAEQTRDASKNIEALLLEVQRETDVTVDAMNEGLVEVEKGTEAISSTYSTFDKIIKEIHLVAEEVRLVSDSVLELRTESLQVIDAVKEVSDIAGTTSQGTQNVLASTEEQSSAMQEINSSAVRLNEMAVELQNIVNKFEC